MDNPEETLVIILSSFLAIFLAVNIIFLILAIRVAVVANRITKKVEALVDKAESAADYVQHAATPMIIGKLLSNLSDTVFKRTSKSKHEDEEE